MIPDLTGVFIEEHIPYPLPVPDQGEALAGWPSNSDIDARHAKLLYQSLGILNCLDIKAGVLERRLAACVVSHRHLYRYQYLGGRVCQEKSPKRDLLSFLLF